MKTIFIPAFYALILVSCSSNQPQNTSIVTTNTTSTQTVTVEAAKPAEQSHTEATGEILMKKSDCFTCHSMDMKIVGPSFKDIADKYEANEVNIQSLTDKVIHGGSGNWGNVAMQAHNQISSEEAQYMVNYILSLSSKP